MKNKLPQFFVFVAMALFVISLLLMRQGFDYKDNYYYNEDYPSLSHNAYVGADAYNLIINGTYFAGYMVLGASAALGGVLSATAAAVIHCLNGEQVKALPLSNEDMRTENVAKQET